MPARIKTKAVQAPTPQQIRNYGFSNPKGGPPSQFFFDQLAFASRRAADYGTPPRHELFWRLIQTINPTYMERHRWSEMLIRALCDEQWCCLAGCSSSGKTHGIVGFAAVWWLCAPLDSIVIFCSTTAKSLRKRGWANLHQFYSSMNPACGGGMPFGHFVDSRLIWQAERGNDRAAIVGIAVEEGDTNKVADNLKGVHEARTLVVADEATSIPAAIFEACTNLYSYGDFQLAMLANPRSRLDQFGRFMCPKNGWGSVTLEDETWETIPQINGRTGICIRFDVRKSPNMDVPADKPISKHLPLRGRVEALLRNPAYADSPSAWSNEYGFPAPEGLLKNVFSESMLVKHEAAGKLTFTGSKFRIIAALDPARSGGDRAALRFAKMGEVTDGIMGIQMYPALIIPIQVQSSNPIDFQIAEQVKRQCEAVRLDGQLFSCAPENLAVDATGGGASLVDILQRIWSPRVERVVFSAAPSEDQISLEDVRPAKEVYRNLRCEMYFRARAMVESGQLKGMDLDTQKEIVNVTFMDSEDNKGKIVLISKRDYKLKYQCSPDLSDTVAILAELARRRGFSIKPLGQTVYRSEDFHRIVQSAQTVYDGRSHYTEDNEVFEEEYA